MVVGEGEGEGHVERLGSVGVGRPLPRLEGHHEVDPARRAAPLEHLNEVRAEYAAEQALKLAVNPWSNNQTLSLAISLPNIACLI